MPNLIINLTPIGQTLALIGIAFLLILWVCYSRRLFGFLLTALGIALLVEASLSNGNMVRLAPCAPPPCPGLRTEESEGGMTRHNHLNPNVHCPECDSAMYRIRRIRGGTQYGCPRGHLHVIPNGTSDQQFVRNVESSIDRLCAPWPPDAA